MGIRGKTLLTVLVLGLVAGVYVFQGDNGGLFKGQLTTQPNQSAAANLPDLRATLKVVPPAVGTEDVRASIEITNAGPVGITTPFRYIIYINEKEVFSNTDSFTSIAPGDSFSFIYPIPQNVYKYSNTGKIKFILDADDSIEEGNENNNIVEVGYDL